MMKLNFFGKITTGTSTLFFTLHASFSQSQSNDFLSPFSDFHFLEVLVVIITSLTNESFI